MVLQSAPPPGLAEREKWDVILVLKMDRIHRNSKNFTQMMDDLNSWKKQFNSMQEKFDTTSAMGRFVMDIIQRIAQLESEQIGERVKVGMTQKAKKGIGYLGSGEPYGYRFVDGCLKIDYFESGIVFFIYHSYSSFHTLDEIAETLNSRGIKPKKGKEWKKQSVSKILRNPLYCGYVVWDGHIIKLDTEIVPARTYNNVQRLMVERRRNGLGGPHRHLEVG